nr:NACHT domain-containing protein [Prosthecobacter debontii]
MKFPARTCCRLAGIGIGVAIGGPLVGYAGSLLGDMTYDLLGDTLGSEEQLGDSIGGLLGNIAADAFPRAFQAPADYPDFKHDFRRALILSLEQALRGPVPRRYAQSVGQSAAKHSLITRCLNQAADHLRSQMQQAVKKGDSAAFEALFPAGQVDSAFLDLQDDSLASTADTLLAQWYDTVLAPVIESLCATDLPHLGGASEFRRQTLAALAIEFPAAFGSVLKDKDHQRLRIATQRLMLNEVRRTVQRLPQQIAGLNAKLTAFITAHETDSALLAAMDGKLDALQSSVDHGDTQSKARDATTHAYLENLTANQLHITAITRYKANLTARFSIHNAVGIPAVEDPKQKQGPDKIVDLFVQPTCTEQRVSPEEMQEAMKNGQTKTEALLPRLVKDRRVVLLADPGMGKSTLIQWLVTALAAPVPSKDIAPFGKIIPLPIILREVVRDMPRELEKWTWATLLETFLRHRHDEHKPAMAAPLATDDTTWTALLESPEAWFMLDGLDEIGDPAKRRALRDAIWEGFEAHPQARFLITSRVVGYDEAEVHKRLESTPPADHTRDLNSRQLAQLMVHTWLAELLYLAPLYIHLVSFFAEVLHKLKTGLAKAGGRPPSPSRREAPSPLNPLREFAAQLGPLLLHRSEIEQLPEPHTAFSRFARVRIHKVDPTPHQLLPFNPCAPILSTSALMSPKTLSKLPSSPKITPFQTLPAACASCATSSPNTLALCRSFAKPPAAMSASWSKLFTKAKFPSASSIHACPVTSPALKTAWPRPTASMPPSLLLMAPPSSLRPLHPQIPPLPVWPCWWPSATASLRSAPAIKPACVNMPTFGWRPRSDAS